jgi:hypothetical protein
LRDRDAGETGDPFVADGPKRCQVARQGAGVVDAEPPDEFGIDVGSRWRSLNAPALYQH